MSNAGKTLSLIASLSLFSLTIFGQAAKITVTTNKPVSTISRDFWGTNFLYWIEDDASLSNNKLATLLKEMPCTVLRYPGGTVADNFYWKTGTLDNVNLFPYESGTAESDFEEFMTFCKKVGAEPMLVVNTQSFFMQDKVEEGAQYAADWVKYCKEKGYKVRYWEIGNETYWHPVMTAREYGALVAAYAKAMRKVDKDIIISANGHWDVDLVGTKERTDEQYVAELFELFQSGDQKAIAIKMKQKDQFKKGKEVTEGMDKWWDNVLDFCGDQIDMLSIHWYFHENRVADLEPKLNELKAFVTEKMKGKQYKWAMTEYNCNTDDDASRVAGFAEGIGKFLNVGFDVANFWPMRIGGMEHRSMFSLKSIEPQYPYQIFKLFSKELKGKMVSCSSTNKLYTFASVSADQITIVLSGNAVKGETDVNISVPGVDLNSKKISATAYSSLITGKRTVTLQQESVGTNLSDGGISTKVKPDSFVVIILRN